MNLRSRISELERREQIHRLPLTAVELCKWYALHMERNGETGHATQRSVPDSEDWKWYEENGERALECLSILNPRGSGERFVGFSED